MLDHPVGTLEHLAPDSECFGHFLQRSVFRDAVACSPQQN